MKTIKVTSKKGIEFFEKLKSHKEEVKKEIMEKIVEGNITTIILTPEESERAKPFFDKLKEINDNLIKKLEKRNLAWIAKNKK